MNPKSLFAAAIVAACQSALSPPPDPARYLVTERTIDVGQGIRLCMAVDVTNPHGVWWWEPGLDCTSRTTGPGVFTANAAAVSTAPDGGHTVRFWLGTHSREKPRMDVRLLIESGSLQLEGGSEKVALRPRPDLDIPPRWPGMDGPPRG